MDFIELCSARFSARKYTDEVVSDDDLSYIMQCVRLAPSAVNRQPWKFVVVKSAEGRKKVQAAYQRDWFYTAPMYIVAYKNHAEEWVRKYDNKPHGDVDLSIAIEHLTLAATERGLGTCWVCAFDPKVLAAEIPQPEGWEAVAIIPLGHIAEDCLKTEKNRKSLSDIIETI